MKPYNREEISRDMLHIWGETQEEYAYERRQEPRVLEIGLKQQVGFGY
jgi:hypothetical protein